MPEYEIVVTAVCNWTFTIDSDSETDAIKDAQKMIDDNKLGEPDSIDEHEILSVVDVDE
jgi:hypothetical protein